MLAFLKSHPEAGAVGCRLLNGDGTIQWSVKTLPNAGASGAAVMMPRKAIDAAGPLDTRFFYHVDADHCKRIIDAGYRCYYLPEAGIRHLEHKGGTMANLRGALSLARDV